MNHNRRILIPSQDENNDDENILVEKVRALQKSQFQIYQILEGGSEKIKEYIDTRLTDIDKRLMIVDQTVGTQANRIDGLSERQHSQKRLIIDSVKSRIEQDFTNGSGPIMSYIHKSKKINDYIREEIEKHIEAARGVLALSGDDSRIELQFATGRNPSDLSAISTKQQSKLDKTISGLLYRKDNGANNEQLQVRMRDLEGIMSDMLTSFSVYSQKNDAKIDELETKFIEMMDEYIVDLDSVEDRFSKLEEKLEIYLASEGIVKQEPNNFPESSHELTNSNYSLENVIADAKKPKIKKRKGKENKLTLIYDSPNPAKVELRPKDIGSLELTIYSRGMDADEIREKTLVFDPYNPETNDKSLEIFLDEMNSHYADNTLDSLIVSLNNPGLNEYLGKHMSPHFKKIYDLMTDELNSEFKGENEGLTSNLVRVKVEKNKRRPGYGAFSSGKKLLSVLSPILFPLKLFTYLGRIVE
jgi:hypothetical protein